MCPQRKSKATSKKVLNSLFENSLESEVLKSLFADFKELPVSTVVLAGAAGVDVNEVNRLLNELASYNLIEKHSEGWTLKRKPGSRSKVINSFEELIAAYKRKRSAARTFKSYKTYDRESEEAGSQDQWTRAARILAGKPEIVPSKDLLLLGLAELPTLGGLTKAYRLKMKSVHPDKGGSHEESVQIQAAYQRLRSSLKAASKQG